MSNKTKHDLITDEALKQALLENHELKGEVEFLNEVINHAGDPIFVKDDQSRIILANDSFCNLFGLHREDVIGKTLAENVPENEREQFLRIDKQVLTDGVKNVIEETLTTNGHASKTIITTKTRYTDANGDHFLIGVISDISERKLLEQQLREKANTDYLTNLNTRRHFMDLANQELSRLARYDSPLSFWCWTLIFLKKSMIHTDINLVIG